MQEENDVTHGVLLEKLLTHEEKISRSEEKIDVIKQDVHQIRREITPISQGVRTMVHLFKIMIGLGMVAAAFLGIIELMEFINHTHE